MDARGHALSRLTHDRPGQGGMLPDQGGTTTEILSGGC